MFTLNTVVAAPVIVSRAQIALGSPAPSSPTRGSPTPAPARPGSTDAWEMVDTPPPRSSLTRAQVLVASTGVIGPRLPMPAVTAAIGRAAARSRRRRPLRAPRPSAPPTRSPSSRRPRRHHRRRRRARRRDGQGGGHDPARHGDHAGADHDRRRRPPAGAAAGAGRRHGRVVQRDLGGRLHVHERLRVPARQRRVGGNRRERLPRSPR